MCGIAGLLSFGRKVDKEAVQRMTDTLVHRGPDGEGAWVNNTGTVGLGHRRLSIIDLSEGGAQPMHYANGRYTITFNGEIYNYIELKEALQKQGYHFKSGSDTEVLLALYGLKKEKCLHELDGMFAFAIWDEQERTLFCARDRFGEKPFFYSTAQQCFSFGSEMKALLALGVPADINYRKLYNYMLFTILENPDSKTETFYKHISQLEPSHYMTVKEDGSITKKRYWDIDLGKRTILNEREYAEKFRELFALSIQRRLRSDVPVGSSLSGGLDSSSIVMMIDQLKKKDLVQKTFSARFRNFSRDEGAYMDMVIGRTSVEPHFVFPTMESAFHNFEKVLYHQEEPIGSSSVMAQYEVMKLAKDHGITVLLDGQGADEVMAGYIPYWNTYFMQLYKSDKQALARAESAYQAVLGKPAGKHDREFRIKSRFPNAYTGLGNLQRKITSPKSAYFLGMHPDIARQYRHEPNPLPKFNSLKEHLYFSTMGKGLNELLRYADRNAMASSVEVRLPFLYHELVEFLFSVPDDMLLHEGWTKYILRNSMKDILPPEITWRKDKIGYEPPQAEWLGSPMFKDYLQASIACLKKEKIISQELPGMHWNYMTLYAFLSKRH